MKSSNINSHHRLKHTQGNCFCSDMYLVKQRRQKESNLELTPAFGAG